MDRTSYHLGLLSIMVLAGGLQQTADRLTADDDRP